MKISVNKRDLYAALQVVSNSMSGTDLELSSQFVFRPLAGSTDKAEVLTFAGRLFSSCPFQATVEGLEGDPDQAFTVEGARLKQWLRSVSDAPLEFHSDPDTKVVTAVAPKGSQEFKSLDPKAFPYWDDLLDEVEITASLEAGRLTQALEFARLFMADTKMESTGPQFCVTEVRGGAFLSNDKRAGSMALVAGLEKCGIRVFTGDMGGILKFLGTLPSDSMVEILEHSKGFLFRRADGAVFGETKYMAAFPAMRLPMELDDQWWWGLPKDELRTAIPFLLAGASREDNRLYFSRPDNKGPVILGMVSMTGKLKTLEIKPLDSGQHLIPDPEDAESEIEASEATPEFQLSVTCLQKVISSSNRDAIRFGVSQRKGSGFVRFREDREGDQFLTVMAWLRN